MNGRIVNGLAGFDEVQDTNPHAAPASAHRTEYWEAIHVLEDAKFALLTGGNIAGFGDDPDPGTARSYPAGLIFYGKITAFTLLSGRVIAYRRSN